MKTSRLQILILIVIAFLGGYFFGINKVKFSWDHFNPQVNITSKEPPARLSTINFSRFWEVWQILERKYYDKAKLKPDKMLEGAISGMVESIGDPFTVYLPPEQNTNFKQELAGQFTGIGAELGTKDKQIIVIAPLVGSPAEKAGVRAGDKIVKVDGKPTFNWSVFQAVEKIRGPKGTKVTLTVLAKDAAETKDINIIRDVITVKSVDGWVKKIQDVENIKITDKIKSIATTGAIMYVRLSQFGDNTNKDWVELINNLILKIDKEKNFKGIVFDLRNNPGGYLDDAVFISSEFLNLGSKVVIEDDGFNKKTRFVTRKGLLLDYPVVVLINKGSASASEITAAALSENKGIKLIGETSFGKGTIQQASDLGKGEGIHVTVARWLTPNENWVNEKGLNPDVKVSLDSKDKQRDIQLEKAIEELLK